MSICRPGQNMNSVTAQNETGRHFVLSPEGKKRAKMETGTETAWKHRGQTKGRVRSQMTEGGESRTEILNFLSCGEEILVLL